MLYYVLAVAFILPLLVMTYAYVRTGLTLHNSVKEARAMRGDPERFVINSIVYLRKVYKSSLISYIEQFYNNTNTYYSFHI